MKKLMLILAAAAFTFSPWMMPSAEAAQSKPARVKHHAKHHPAKPHARHHLPKHHRKG
ncbi:MAG TPA: hypothetical protein VJT54_02510 [Verrucomicrobiae bacterium]|nr:hypothetical protein [Verrucomicrobiae bacterium]